MEEGKDEKGRFTEKNLFYLLRENRWNTRFYKTPEELSEAIVEYFEWSMKRDGGKFTESGLRTYIGFTRSNWYQYKNREEFKTVVEMVEQILEDYWEKKLGWAGSTQGAIFWLKNKAGWKDEVIQNQNQTVTNVQPVVNSSGVPLANSEDQIKD